jgi:adenylylsulfate kinase
MDTNLIEHTHKITKKDRQKLLKQKSPVIWLTGLSGSGKSTVANELATQLHKQGVLTYILDGDNIRMGLNKDLGFSDNDRKENIRRIAEVAKLISDTGVVVITAFISPFKKERHDAKKIIGDNNFIEVFIDAPLHICEERDPKGLYKKARSGEIPMFTGIDSPYESPTNPNVIVKTSKCNVDKSVDGIIEYLKHNEFVKDSIKTEWPHINHGGNPTSNKDNKRAIFIGRYQPYHNGHTSLIKQKLNCGVPVLIMVRDIEPDNKNPFTTEQTVLMIEKYHASKGDDVKVMVIPDIESVNYGRGVGYEINEFTPTEEIAFISATKIRESIKTGDSSWKRLIDVSIQEDIKNYLIINKVFLN